MRAFINSKVSKRELIEALEQHAERDAIVDGMYVGFAPADEGSDEPPRFQGCAVGCSLQDFGERLSLMEQQVWWWTDSKDAHRSFSYWDVSDSDDWHMVYEEAFSIPWKLARDEDETFESFHPGSKLQKEWPLRFARAVPVGADLSDVSEAWHKWCVERTAIDGDTPSIAEGADKLIELIESAPVREE